MHGVMQRHGSCRIVVIGSDLELREVMAEVLELAGHQVTTFPRDWAVLEDAAIRSHPELIVLDLGIADYGQLQGWDYLRRLRTHSTLGKVPVLVCSDDIQAMRQRADTLSADPMVLALESPFRLDDLESAVAELIDGHPVPVWDDSRDLVLVADEGSRLIDASQPALELLGFTMEELRGRSVADIVARDAVWTTGEWERYLAARQWVGDVTLRTVDGREIPACAKAEILALNGQEWHISRLELASSTVPEPV